MDRVFIKTEIPNYKRLPQKSEIIDQSLRKSFEEEPDISQIKLESSKFFKIRAEEGKKLDKSRNMIPTSKSEMNTSSSFLRKNYFNKNEQSSLVAKTAISPRIRENLKPDCKHSYQHLIKFSFS